MGYSDAVTQDLNSVSSNEEEGIDTSARDAAAPPRFLRPGEAITPAPSVPAAGYEDEKGTHLPRFMRTASPDGLSAVLEADGTPAGHTPAVKQHVGTDGMKSLSDAEQKKRARNRADLRNSHGVVKTTVHSHRRK